VFAWLQLELVTPLATATLIGVPSGTTISSCG
jgi:hypothetical protein